VQFNPQPTCEETHNVPRVIRNEHRFDGVAAVHAEQPLVGGIGRLLLERVFGTISATASGFSRSALPIRHRRSGGVVMINPLHHLLARYGFSPTTRKFARPWRS
jgi:hypothetical protein